MTITAQVLLLGDASLEERVREVLRPPHFTITAVRTNKGFTNTLRENDYPVVLLDDSPGQTSLYNYLRLEHPGVACLMLVGNEWAEPENDVSGVFRMDTIERLTDRIEDRLMLAVSKRLDRMRPMLQCIDDAERTLKGST